MAVRNVAHPMPVGAKTLRRGTKILIPFRQLQLNKSVWGANAREFDQTRFHCGSGSESASQPKEGRSRSSASPTNPNFRPFGGGTTICPGRFIARREILAFVALAIVRFDLSLAADAKADSGGDDDDDVVKDVNMRLGGGRADRLTTTIAGNDDDDQKKQERPRQKRNKFPRVEEGKPCLGMMPPAEGENVRL